MIIRSLRRLMASPDHGGHEVLVEAGEAVLGASVVTGLQQSAVTNLRSTVTNLKMR